MLSYRHAFHAGNHADVLKHSILSRIFLYSCKKPGALTFFDTHSGAGLYFLDQTQNQQTQEAEHGILSLLQNPNIPETLKDYLKLCKNHYALNHSYPGSPEIARFFLRKQDSIVAMELHSSEIENLRANLKGDQRVHLHHRNGFEGILALTPPQTKRGIVLIDPSYETAQDWTDALESIIAVHKRWQQGIIALWYPIVPRKIPELESLVKGLFVSGIPNILNVRLCIRSPLFLAEGYGLAGSGMILINPPWTLYAEIESFLPWLSEQFSKEKNAPSDIRWIQKPL